MKQDLAIDFECTHAQVMRVSYPHVVPFRSLPTALFLQLRGGSYAVDMPGRRTVMVRAGEALVMPGGKRHALRLIERKDAVSVWSHASFTLRSGVDLFALIRVPLVLDAQSGARIGAINAGLANLRQPARAAAFQSELHAHAQVQELGFRLLQILAEHAEPVADGPRREGIGRLLPVLNYIRDHLAEPLSRAELAQIAHLSETRFHALFKETMRLAPMEFVQQQRLALAKRLLLERDLSVAAIAAQVGFADADYFSRLFGVKEGQAPTQYRESVRRMMQ